MAVTLQQDADWYHVCLPWQGHCTISWSRATWCGTSLKINGLADFHRSFYGEHKQCAQEWIQDHGVGHSAKIMEQLGEDFVSKILWRCQRFAGCWTISSHIDMQSPGVDWIKHLSGSISFRVWGLITSSSGHIMFGQELRSWVRKRKKQEKQQESCRTCRSCSVFCKIHLIIRGQKLNMKGMMKKYVLWEVH